MRLIHEKVEVIVLEVFTNYLPLLKNQQFFVLLNQSLDNMFLLNILLTTSSKITGQNVYQVFLTFVVLFLFRFVDRNSHSVVLTSKGICVLKKMNESAKNLRSEKMERSIKEFAY